MKLLAELRRRNVIRMAGLYLVGSWLLVQIAETLLPIFRTPEWVLQVLVALLAFGLLPVLIFSWIYELTPTGLRRESEIDHSQAIAGRTAQRLDIAVIVLLVFVATITLMRSPASPPQTPAQLAPVAAADAPAAVLGESPVVGKTIAVLPFADFSADGDQAWFSDGLTEEILNALARAPDLKVASRTASFQFRNSDQPLDEIARRLGVANILEGSVRRAPTQLRVTAQLIRVSDGFHLWSENFDGGTDDAIAIQEQIALKIAMALRTAMDPEALGAMVSAGTRSVEAWEAFLHAQALDEEANRTGDHRLTLDTLPHYERAASIDPGFARAHMRIAWFWRNQITAYSHVDGLVDLPPAEIRSRFDRSMEAAISSARSLAERLEYQALQAGVRFRLRDEIALLRQLSELRPGDADVHIALGAVLADVGDYPAARALLLEAAELGRGTGSELIGIAQVLHRADPEAAVPLIERALALQDIGVSDLYQAHRALLHAGRVEQAAVLAAEYLLRAPSDAMGLRLVQLRQACAEGRVDDAESLFAGRVESDGNHWLMLRTLGRDDEAVELHREFDTPERLLTLRGLLPFPFFDVSDYPLLATTLASQGIQRPPPRPIPFACRRK